jgi:hypothetical protein
LQSEFLFLTQSAIGRGVHETQPLAQQRLGLLHCRSRQGVSAGLQPVFCGLVDQPGLCEVVSQEFRARLNDIGELHFKNRSDAGVQLLPPAAQQGAVGGVLDQRVLDKYSAAGGAARWKTRPASRRRRSASCRSGSAICTAAASSSREKSRPMAAPTCATFLAAGPSRSRRPSSQACKVAGTASDEGGTAAIDA